MRRVEGPRLGLKRGDLLRLHPRQQAAGPWRSHRMPRYQFCLSPDAHLSLFAKRASINMAHSVHVTSFCLDFILIFKYSLFGFSHKINSNCMKMMGEVRAKVWPPWLSWLEHGPVCDEVLQTRCPVRKLIGGS